MNYIPTYIDDCDTVVLEVPSHFKFIETLPLHFQGFRQYTIYL